MERDEEINSQSDGKIIVTFDTLTLALPIQQPKTIGREDGWTDAATAVLIEAWGKNYLESNRGKLKQQQWKDVVETVNSRHDCIKTPKSEVQIKNRIDTVKRKYKSEKSKMNAGGGASNWPFFDRIDELIGPVRIRSTPASQERLQSKQFPQFGKRLDDLDLDRDSEPGNSTDSLDDLPPPESSSKRPKLANNANVNKKSDGVKNKDNSDWGNSAMDLMTGAILRFGEVYEKSETAKVQQLVDLEKVRMQFSKDLELQRMQFFVKAQLELSQIKHGKGGNGNNYREVNDSVNRNRNNSDGSD